MNIANIEVKTIDRIIAHEIYPKTEKKDAYAIAHTELLKFSKAEKDILISRIQEALSNSSKTFQLEYEDKSDGSIYTIVKEIKSKSDKEFISITKSLADNLADSHFRTKIPGGYCLIGDGKTKDDKIFFFIIKAELQEVFNIENNKLVLIKDVFLSPAKDFYKIGFFIESGKKYLPFMYDDQFSLQKKDLTEYFYGKFLGLTTDKNDKLKSKNFFDDTKLFIDNNVENLKDKIGLLGALKTLYREDTTGVISPKDFSDTYLEGKLKDLFDKKIVTEKYPISFTKDIELIENRIDLQRISIPLSYGVTIVGNTTDLNELEIINDPSKRTLQELEPQINNGQVKKIVILKQAN